MTGDDLVTMLTEAPTFADACAIADRAPIAAVVDAADLLYVPESVQGARALRNAVPTYARA